MNLYHDVPNSHVPDFNFFELLENSLSMKSHGSEFRLKAILSLNKIPCIYCYVILALVVDNSWNKTFNDASWNISDGKLCTREVIRKSAPNSRHQSNKFILF